MNAAELLSNSLSPDATTRENATKQLESAARDNFHGYMHTLAAELANEQTDPHIRNAAGLAFKNALAARDEINQPELTARWLALPAEARNPIKLTILQTLGSPTARAGAVAAQAVAAIAAIELPVDIWPELIGTMLEFVNNQENTLLRISTLQAFGYVCEVIKPEILATRSNEILTAVVQGARKEEPSAEVQTAAIHALYNSLEFIRENFEAEGERNYIMQVVCEATQNPAVVVQVGAFECLVRIMTLYYDKMAFYMERALFGLTVLGMKHPEEAVALQAIEFWSAVCDEEQELAIEAADAAEYGEIPEVESQNFAKTALPEILPVFLELLCQQDEDADDDEWNRSMAAGNCLGLLASTVGDSIVQPVIPFVEAGITQQDWRPREAAVMAFGSILDGPDPAVLTPFVTQALPPLIDMMQNDPSPHVKDTVAWTLGRITNVMVELIKPDVHLQNFITAVVHGLEGSNRIVGNCCWSLTNLAEQMGSPEGDELPTSAMSPYYEGVLKALMRVSERQNESYARTAAYQTISVFITNSANDTLEIVSNVALAILDRQEQLLGMQNQIVGNDDRNNWNELQGNFCHVIASVVRKLGARIEPLADRIMTNLLQLVSSAGKQTTVLEDAFIAVGALTSALETGFLKYMDAFSPFLFSALASYEDYQVASTAVGVTGDLSRALKESLAPYAERIMTALIDALRSPVLQRSVKPAVITVIGDVALAIGPAFLPYTEATMSILNQAGQASTDATDAVMAEFIWSMRESIVEAFVGILSAFRAEPVHLQQYVPGMLQFVRMCLADDDRTDALLGSSLGLMGDIGDVYGAAAKPELLADWVSSALAAGRARGTSKSTRDSASYCRGIIKRISAL